MIWNPSFLSTESFGKSSQGDSHSGGNEDSSLLEANYLSVMSVVETEGIATPSLSANLQIFLNQLVTRSYEASCPKRLKRVPRFRTLRQS